MRQSRQMPLGDMARGHRGERNLVNILEKGPRDGGQCGPRAAGDDAPLPTGRQQFILRARGATLAHRESYDVRYRSSGLSPGPASAGRHSVHAQLAGSRVQAIAAALATHVERKPTETEVRSSNDAAARACS